MRRGKTVIKPTRNLVMPRKFTIGKKKSSLNETLTKDYKFNISDIKTQS